MNKMKRALIEGKEKEVSKYVKSITGIEEKDKKAKGLSPDFPSAAPPWMLKHFPPYLRCGWLII